MIQNHFLVIVALAIVTRVHCSLLENSKEDHELHFSSDYGYRTLEDVAADHEIIIKKLKDELFNITSHVRELENNISLMQGKKLYEENEMNELKEKMANYTAKFSEEQVVVNTHKKYIYNLTVKVNFLNKEKNTLKAEIAELQTCCNGLNIAANNLRRDIHQNTTDVNELITEINDLKRQINRLEDENHSTVKEIRILSESIAKIQTEKTPVKDSTEDNARYDVSNQYGYKYYPGMGYYKYVKESKTWLDAFQDCFATGGHLLIINSEAEVELFKDLISSMCENAWYGTLWVGITDFNEVGKFYDIKGNPIAETGYEIWAQYEPGNQAGHEHCVSVTDCGQYHDYPCKTKMSYVCEMPPESY